MLVRATDDEDEDEEEEDEEEEEGTEEEGAAVRARGFAGTSALLGDTAAGSEEEEEEEDIEEALGQYELLAKRKRIDGYEPLVHAASTALLLCPVAQSALFPAQPVGALGQPSSARGADWRRGA